MPKSCPACGRPNADRVTLCLYCTAPLDVVVTASEPDAGDAAESQPPCSDRCLIILAPQPDASVTDGQIQAFASATGLSLYDARLALSTRRHRLLRKVAPPQEAAALSKRIAKLGVRHLNIAEADVESLPVVRVRSVGFQPERLEVGLANKDMARVKNSELLLLVKGEIARARHQEGRRAIARGASRPLTPGLRLHLFSVRTSAALELDPEQFDWSVLGPARSISTLINFKRLLEEIRDRTAGAELDCGFDMEPIVLSRSRAGTEVDSVLGSGHRNQEGVVYDNEAQFRFYARWRYLVAREELKQRQKPASG